MKVLFKYTKSIPENAIVIDTTSNSGEFKELSPFILSTPPAKRFENLWQFSKVYPCHLDPEYGTGFSGWMNIGWYQWQKRGFDDLKAHRYPMGKGAKPVFTYWKDEKLGYIEARKKLYAYEYGRHVVETRDYNTLMKLYLKNKDNLILLDYDAYDHQSQNMSLEDVLNNPLKKMGHAFVLMMLLTGEWYDLIYKYYGSEKEVLNNEQC